MKLTFPPINKNLRNALIAVAAVVAVVLVLPFVVPMDAYRVRIESAARELTGRTLTIEGPLRLMFFPHFGLKAQRVTFANMPGGSAAAMATVGDIELAVRVLPLLTGHVELERIVLDRPVIALEVDRSGAENWQFGKASKAAVSKGESAVTLPLGTEFSGIKITDGRIAYDNFKSGTHRSLDHVNATVAITRLDHPVTVDGNFTLGGKRVDFDARIVTIKTLVGNGTTALDLSATSDMMQASFKGLLDAGGGLNGTFKLDTPSFRNVAGWLGEPLPAGQGLNGLSLESHIVSQDKVTTLEGLRLALDHQNMMGMLVLDMRGTVPLIDGRLSVDHLDLNPYLAPGGGGATSPHRSEPGWSRAPISFALLKKVDGKLTLDAGSVRVRALRLGRTVLNVTLDGGALAAKLDPVTLYGGSGRAELDVDSRGPVPAIRNTLAFQGVSLRPFLDDTLGVDSIEGTGSLTLAVSSRGASAYAIMHGLSGRGSIAAGAGRFRGVDLGLVARTIQRMLGGEATGRVATTDFARMGGSFAIANGVLAANDFRLAGPAVQMTGSGSVDIGGRTVDFRLVPQTAVKGVSVGIPFRVRGSWDHVHYVPDLAGLVGGVLKNLETGRAPFKGLFGGAKGHKKKSVGEELKGLFGGH